MLPLEFVGERSLRGAHARNGRRRVQPQGRPRARGRDQPPAPGRVSVLYGAMPLSSRREEIDRFLGGTLGRHGRHRRARPRGQPPLRDAALRRDDEVRRRVATRPAAVGARADRRPGGALRARRARARRRADGRAVGERRPGDRRGGARSPTSCCPRATSATASSTRRASGRGSPISASTIRGASTPRSPPGTASRRASWAYESWLAVESLTPDPGRLAAIQRRLAERSRRLVARGHVEADQRSRGRGQRRAARDARARASAGDTAQRSLLTFLLDPARLRDATLEEAEQAGRTASILRWFALQYPGVGGVTIERAAALEEAAAARVVARLRVEVSAPTIGRCRTCGQTCAPWFPLCDRCFGRR